MGASDVTRRESRLGRVAASCPTDFPNPLTGNNQKKYRARVVVKRVAFMRQNTRKQLSGSLNVGVSLVMRKCRRGRS